MSMKTRGSTGTKGIGTKRKRENDAADSSGSSSIPESDHDSKRLRTALTDDAFKNVPLFLTKTYNMINECDPAIASWSDDGEMIVVKDPTRFASKIIPNFFGHNKFSSFARQLNFYGFRKIPSLVLRKTDSNHTKSKVVTFQNAKFKRGHPELMSGIIRSTKSSHNENSFQQKEIDRLKGKLHEMEELLGDLQVQFDSKILEMQEHFEKKISELIQAYKPQPPTNPTRDLVLQPNHTNQYQATLPITLPEPEPVLTQSVPNEIIARAAPSVSDSNPVSVSPPSPNPINSPELVISTEDDDWLYVNFFEYTSPEDKQAITDQN